MSYSSRIPCVGTHATSTRFPRKNDTPETQPLRSTSSTWSLADTGGPIDRNPELHPEQPKRDTLGGDESGPQGPSTGPIQADGYEPQVDPSNPNQLAPEDHARRTGMTGHVFQPIGLWANLCSQRPPCPNVLSRARKITGYGVELSVARSFAF